MDSSELVLASLGIPPEVPGFLSRTIRLDSYG